MNGAALVLPDWIAAELASAAKQPVETAGTILAGVARTRDGVRLFGNQLHLVPDDGYDIREPDRLSIPSRSYVDVLAAAERGGLSVIFFHTHPGEVGDPRPSPWDDRVDAELAETFRIRTGSHIYASLVTSPSDVWFRFTGRGRDGDEEFTITRIMVSGDRLARLPAYDSAEPEVDDFTFDRNIRAFGGGIQAALNELHVAVIGCGGTGSAVAEQLVRLGTRSILLVDPDVLTESNVTRVYGSTADDIGRPKPYILAGHLQTIAPSGEFQPLHKSVLDEDVARALTACDVIFGCTDDNAGRLILTRLAAYYLIPLIDCGVLISSAAGAIEAIHGRVTIQTPGAACLVCRGRIDLTRAAAEQLPRAERMNRQREGYAPELGIIEPAVVSFTTAVAAQAVTELLERFIGFGPIPVPTEVLLRIHDREVGSNRIEPRHNHLCDPDGGLLGVGDQVPFIGQLWRPAS